MNGQWQETSKVNVYLPPGHTQFPVYSGLAIYCFGNFEEFLCKTVIYEKDNERNIHL